MDAPFNVNLARKLRPRTFDQIVGQGLSTKILQNSLYLKKYFPVYLFAGQRGCGKTTTARVFAAAVNCHQLSFFQQSPSKHPLPCLTCTSCLAMAEGNHPDFTEIDAASHTGVDNVRQIIESAAYVPLLGEKKVYLIDEAHMLSKAAFNAFLKILEEPPQTVLFMLATTERHKIPETVLSRCFQLTITPIARDNLKTYLAAVCKEESILVDDLALDLIIEETDGSARDALNLLEQVRFSDAGVTQETMVNILGKVSVQTIVQLMSLVIEQNPEALLAALKNIAMVPSSAQLIWQMVVEFLRALMWIKYGVEPEQNHFSRHGEELKTLANVCDRARLYAMLTVLWDHEMMFLQTTQKQIFLEMILLQLCCLQVSSSGHSEKQFVPKKNLVAPPVQIKPVIAAVVPTQEVVQRQEIKIAPAKQASPIAEKNSVWEAVLDKILTTSNDSFLNAILQQAVFIGYKQDVGVLTIRLSNDGAFFKDKVRECSTLYKPIMTEHFAGFMAIEFAEALPASGVTTMTTTSALTKTNEYGKSKSPTENARTLNVSDKERWPSANLLLDHFPGVIKVEE